MAVVNLTIGAVNITNYLIVTIAKTSAPNVEIAREVYAPGSLTAPTNVVVPSSGSIDAAVYYVTYRESTDGVALGMVLGTFVYDARNKKPLSETIFYLGGGARDVDPDANQGILIDPYLDGKNITKVQKEGFGPLVPPSYDFKQYDLHAGGGIELLNGLVFTVNEIISVEITYALVSEDSSGNGANMYNGTILLINNTPLTPTHRNKRLKCETSADRMLITLEDITIVPDGTYYYFNSNGGNQHKVRIIPYQVGQQIAIDGALEDEISIGNGEFARVEKYGATWEVTCFSPALVQVGERIAKGVKAVNNALPEDGSLHDGDVEPRLWYFINKLPVTHVVTDDQVIINGYTHPVGKEGMFVKHSTLKQFRMPNSQGWYYRGLKDYSTYNSDLTNRPIDYPGGTEKGRVGPHTHPVPVPKGLTSKTQDGYGRFVMGNDGNEPVDGPTLGTSVPSGTGSDAADNIVKNIGEIFQRRS
jgi:hypothetical protein